jgi:DMSO/TMAO reductase YedYZ molybdopterin-dependent catalytic subunit
MDAFDEARGRATGPGPDGVQRLDRRAVLRLAAACGAGALLASCGDGDAARRERADRPRPGPRTIRCDEKTDLILLTDRPPQLETPLRFFREDLTPNEAFYVRWHLAVIPATVDTRAFRLNLGGHVERPLALSLHELRTAFTPVSTIAVNQCSGNSRSLYLPRVPGSQWGNGAVGNARWTGVRLKDLLARAGVKAGAAQVSFQGLDRAVLPGTPAFVKALDIDHAMADEVLVAYAMNGAALPMLNGFPLRLVVPGWYATYWVKALSDIQVLPARFSGFWMDKAYRIPKAPDAQEAPDHLATETVPINRLSVRSLFVRPEPDEVVRLGTACEIEGLAIDSGRGIARVEVSTDDGATWSEARLDPELGRYSWRRWRARWTPAARGAQRILARATNGAGETQVPAQWNRSGYARNVIERLAVTVV